MQAFFVLYCRGLFYLVRQLPLIVQICPEFFYETAYCFVFCYPGELRDRLRKARSHGLKPVESGVTQVVSSVLERLVPHGAFYAVSPHVILEIFDVTVIIVREPCFQHRENVLRRLAADQEFEKIYDKAYGRAVTDVARAVREYRQSVFLKNTSYDRLHRAFVICYQLDLTHPVSKIPDEVPYISSCALRFIVRVCSAHYREVLRKETGVLRFFCRAENILPQVSFQTLYRFTSFQLIRSRYLFTADANIIFRGKLCERSGEALIKAEIAFVDNESDRLCSLRKLHYSAGKFRSNAVISVDPDSFTVYELRIL